MQVRRGRREIVAIRERKASEVRAATLVLLASEVRKAKAANAVLRGGMAKTARAGSAVHAERLVRKAKLVPTELRVSAVSGD